MNILNIIQTLNDLLQKDRQPSVRWFEQHIP